MTSHCSIEASCSVLVEFCGKTRGISVWQCVAHLSTDFEAFCWLTHTAISSQKWKIMSCKMKIEQLKEAVTGGNEGVKNGECLHRWSLVSQGFLLHAPFPPPTDKDLLLRSQEESQRLQRRAGRHQEKRDKIERHNHRLGELLERRSRELQSRLSQLAVLRRDHILELTTHIFPTQEEKQGSR